MLAVRRVRDIGEAVDALRISKNLPILTNNRFSFLPFPPDIATLQLPSVVLQHHLYGVAD
jgi:hypothetical protein